MRAAPLVVGAAKENGPTRGGKRHSHMFNKIAFGSQAMRHGARILAGQCLHSMAHARSDESVACWRAAWVEMLEDAHCAILSVTEAARCSLSAVVPSAALYKGEFFLPCRN